MPTYTAGSPLLVCSPILTKLQRLTTRGGARHNLSARKKLIKPFCICRQYKFTGSAVLRACDNAQPCCFQTRTLVSLGRTILILIQQKCFHFICNIWPEYCYMFVIILIHRIYTIYYILRNLLIACDKYFEKITLLLFTCSYRRYVFRHREIIARCSCINNRAGKLGGQIIKY